MVVILQKMCSKQVPGWFLAYYATFLFRKMLVQNKRRVGFYFEINDKCVFQRIELLPFSLFSYFFRKHVCSKQAGGCLLVFNY